MRFLCRIMLNWTFFSLSHNRHAYWHKQNEQKLGCIKEKSREFIVFKVFFWTIKHRMFTILTLCNLIFSTSFFSSSFSTPTYSLLIFYFSKRKSTFSKWWEIFVSNITYDLIYHHKCVEIWLVQCCTINDVP